MKGIGLMLVAIYFAYLAVHFSGSKNQDIPCILVLASIMYALVGMICIIVGC